ncbi:VOC family protein [Myxococcota bacterium]|nr:VOC family protein [Myxococcota bacterium]
MGRMIFVNLPVRDLERSKAFFSKLGFEFNPKFTDEKAACMIIEKDASYAMLLVEPFFQGFMNKKICDTKTHTESLIALSCSSRAEVEKMVSAAIAAGGSAAMPPNDHGFMYQSSFYDLDGHHWEVFWMDPKAAE